MRALIRETIRFFGYGTGVLTALAIMVQMYVTIGDIGSGQSGLQLVAMAAAVLLCIMTFCLFSWADSIKD